MADPLPNEPPAEFIHRLSKLGEDYNYIKLLWAGLKPHSRRMYTTAIKSYEGYCMLNGLTAWPATRRSIGRWIVARGYGSSLPGMGQVKGSTLQSYYSALRSVHVALDLPLDVFNSPHLQLLINGVTNTFPGSQRSPRTPITRDLLKELLSERATSGEDPITRVNVNAACTMAFAGFLRLGEFTYLPSQLTNPARLSAEALTRRCISISAAGDHYTLYLPRSKADKDNKGVSLVIAAASDEACPLTHMGELLRKDPQPDRAPLLRLHNGPLTRAAALKVLEARLQRIGRANQGFKGHSFRRGAAQEAYNNHMTEEEIQTLGRWSSDSVRRYYKAGPTRLYGLQKLFQTGKPFPIQEGQSSPPIRSHPK